MAESAAFSLASKILSTIASPAFDKAYERGLSIWEARDELNKLRVTIGSVQDVLLDAEKKQKGSAAVKNWIKRLKGVLYDAEDLFDEVVTDDLLKQQMMEGKDKLSLKNKVRVSCSKLNPIVSRNSIAKQVKAIRKSLLEISNDMGQFGFVRSLEEQVFGKRVERDPGSFVDPKYVFGRDEDKKVILEMLINESSNAGSDAPGVISIVGIGGMGKTTLAQLIYNDEEVKRGFEKKWFTCISDTTVEKEVLGKIFQSVCEGSYSDFDISQLQTKIRESIEGKKFLLVLDDVWDEDHARWQHRMSLLSGGAKGSKIIVTTRSSSVAIAVDAFKTHILQGLSEDDSWDLFKRVAFTPERENDSRWTILGREIVKKCARVPLAIRSIGSLLYTKTTIQEWESIRDQELSKLKEQSDPESILSMLQLSYDHLPSNLKHCFAYCSIFPKDFDFDVEKLVYLWIAQGYVKPNEGESVEVAGRSYFMSLLRRSFFQEAQKDGLGEITKCKMHDLVHDLAQNVAGEEVVMLKASCSGSYNSARHVGGDCGTVDVGKILQEKKLNMRILRSLMLMNPEGRSVSWDLDRQLRSGKYLRALSLSHVGIEDVPSSIGELKLLRYLDLSGNKFKRLPDSIPYLLNLVALDLKWCEELEALPDDFRKLINLEYLEIQFCYKLKHMPHGFGELGSLRYLTEFKVGRKKAITRSSEEKERVGIEKSGTSLDALSRLGQLRGLLRIEFDVGIKDWDGDECSWQLPVSLQKLTICRYPGDRIQQWANNNNGRAILQLPNLVCIHLLDCPKVKYLPRFRDLPYLKQLQIGGLEELEYIEEEDEEEIINEEATGLGNDSSSLFFPCLEILVLWGCSKLKGWSRRDVRETTSTPPPIMPISISMQQQQHLSSPVLSQIKIDECLGLDFLSSDLQKIELRLCNQMKTLSFVHPHLSFPVLSHITIWNCPELKSLPSSALGSKTIELFSCDQLKTLSFAHPEVLEELAIFDCPEFGLGSVDWDSLPNLRRLKLDPLPPPGELPECLQRRRLQIRSTRNDDVLSGEEGSWSSDG